MTRENILKEVTEIFRESFDDETLEINDSTTAADIEDWDSLMHITLITAIEEQFNIKFKLKEVTSLQSVGDTIDLIMEKVNE
ncbi:MAG: acyl carrier protein [Agathobacter sp.]|nr:acyl carrier protein [Agathobacter sp.]